MGGAGAVVGGVVPVVCHREARRGGGRNNSSSGTLEKPLQQENETSHDRRIEMAGLRLHSQCNMENGGLLLVDSALLGSRHWHPSFLGRFVRCSQSCRLRFSPTEPSLFCDPAGFAVLCQHLMAEVIPSSLTRTWTRAQGDVWNRGWRTCHHATLSSL